MKKLIAISLTMVSLLSLVGCGGKDANKDIADNSNSNIDNIESIERVSDRFKFVNLTTGILECATVYDIIEELGKQDIEVNDLNLDNVKFKEANDFDGIMYKVSIINHSEVALNNETEQYELALDLGNDTKYSLQLGHKDDITEKEAKAYAPKGNQLTFIGLGQITEDKTRVIMRPIFVGTDNMGYYTVKSNLCHLGLSADGMCDIVTAVNMNKIIAEKGTEAEEKPKDEENNAVIAQDGLEIELVSTESGSLQGIFKNNNDFGAWVDKAECYVNGNKIGEPFLRAEAKSECSFTCLYGDEFVAGDIVTFKGIIKNTDTSFSKLGDFSMVFEIK